MHDVADCKRTKANKAYFTRWNYQPLSYSANTYLPLYEMIVSPNITMSHAHLV